MPSTKVLFRKYKNGNIIALFPEEHLSDVFCPGYFAKVGALHCELNFVLSVTTAASPKEYASLKRTIEEKEISLTVIKGKFHERYKR